MLLAGVRIECRGQDEATGQQDEREDASRVRDAKSAGCFAICCIRTTVSCAEDSSGSEARPLAAQFVPSSRAGCHCCHSLVCLARGEFNGRGRGGEVISTSPPPPPPPPPPSPPLLAPSTLHVRKLSNSASYPSATYDIFLERLNMIHCTIARQCAMPTRSLLTVGGEGTEAMEGAGMPAMPQLLL